MFTSKSGAMVRLLWQIPPVVAVLAAVVLFLPDISILFGRSYDEFFQLALGLNVACGRWPGVDFFTNYGPGVAVVSGASWQTANPVATEVILSFLFVGAGVVLFWLNATAPGARMAALFFYPLAVVSLPSWAKYYYVFFPQLLLFLLGDLNPSEGVGRGRLRWLSAGFVTGVAGWFRPELGCALLASVCAALAYRSARYVETRRRAVVELFMSAAGFFLPWIGYFGWLSSLKKKWVSPWDLLDFFVCSTVAKIEQFARRDAIPAFQWPLESQVATGWFGLLLLVAAISSIGWLAFSAYSKREAPPVNARLWCSAIVFCSLAPQALHRMDAVHTRQILLPGFLTLILLTRAFTWELRGGGVRVWKICVPALIAVSVCFLMIAMREQFPLAKRSLRWRVEELGKGFRASAAGRGEAATLVPIFEAARKAGIQTLLVPSLDARWYVLSGLHFSGPMPHYSFSLTEKWQQRALAALERHPPDLVFCALDYDAPKVGGNLKRLSWIKQLSWKGRNPAIEKFIDDHYPVVIFENESWRLLGQRPLQEYPEGVVTPATASKL
jgi:hypothetical protein